MRTHIEFHSMEFNPYADEDEIVNPGRYGRRLAEYIQTSLSELGIETHEIYSEDWGWVVPIKNDAFPLWIGCGNYEEFENGFLCFIEPSKPYIRRLFRKIDTTVVVEQVAVALEQALSKSPGISKLRWWAEDEH